MIVVFVVDTSPSMSRPVSSSSGSATRLSGMSRLDLAKMVVEDVSRRLRKGCMEHNVHVCSNSNNNNNLLRSFSNIGQGPSRNDALLLLSTSRQHPDTDTSTCAAGGRLLVGFGSSDVPSSDMSSSVTDNPSSCGDTAHQQHQQHEHLECFQRELKGLQAAKWNSSSGEPFPEDAGGAVGLNAALSAGLQLLSRYRLQHSLTENFGMGRLPNIAVQTPGSSSITNAGPPALAALQPAVLILVTDGACLRQPASTGGGSLQLQYGSQPLREFYKEPFRWDQRVYCLVIGNGDYNVNNEKKGQSSYLHPQLRALCEVTGGSHWLVRKPSGSGLPTDSIIKHLRPPMPRELPLPDPLYLSLGSSNNSNNNPIPQATSTITTPPGLSFVHGGPICCFQALEGEEGGRPAVQRRAMLLYTGSPATSTTSTTSSFSSDGGSSTTTTTTTLNQPLWSIPETFFPSKKLDTLPPRSAQPLLLFSKYPSNLGSKTFDPLKLIKMLHRLDQAILTNRKLMFNPANTTPAGQQQQLPSGRFLHRDVYVLEWLSPEGGGGSSSSSNSNKPIQVTVAGSAAAASQYYFPVLCPGAGRAALSAEEGDGGNFLNIGILHAPPNCTTLGTSGGNNLASSTSTSSASSSGGASPVNGGYRHPQLATLTLLPPEPHILLPLLLRAAEAEHRVLKKAAESSNTMNRMQQQQQRTVTPLDEHWRTEFLAYMFRIPPYYHHNLKRSLRFVLPASAHSLLHTEVGGLDSLPLQCFSKVCLQKIRNAEQISRDTNERLERQEASLRYQSNNLSFAQQQQPQSTDPLQQQQQPLLRYGQYDPRSSDESYLAALRSMPPPPGRAAGAAVLGSRLAVDESSKQQQDIKSDTASMISDNYNEFSSPSTPIRTVVDVLGDLPVHCLMAYYESRRRWIFGGPSLTTRGLHVEGVNNDGSNSQRCGRTYSDREECPLSLAGVGVSVLNETSTTKMGDYRERLLFSRSPVVGRGGTNDAGVAATTAADGSPVWSVDDDAMPLTFFDPKTGEFSDSVQARVRSRLMVNFGNPYKEKRADSLIPEKFYSQAPSMQQGGFGSIVGSPRTPPGSPPQDSFDSVEEGEAMFVRTSPSRTSPKREEPEDPITSPLPKRPRTDSMDESDATFAEKTVESKPPAPPKSPALTAPPKPRSAAAPPPPAPPPSVPSVPSVKQPVPPPSKPAPPKKAPPPPPRPPPPKPAAVQRQGSVPLPPKPSQPVPANIPEPPPSARRSSSSPSIKGPPPLAATSSLPNATLTARKTSPVSTTKLKVQGGGSLTGVGGGGGLPPPPQLGDTAPQSPDQKPQVDLPPGWMCVWSKSQKRWYYFDTKTNKSVWKWPP